MNGPDYLPTDPPRNAAAAVIQAVEAECGYVREACPWCAAGGDSAQCIACNGRGYFLRERAGL